MEQIFPIVPASAKAMYFLAFVCAALLAVTGMLGFLCWSVRHSQVTVRSDSIRLFGDLWGRSVPRHALRIDQARVVDLRADSDLRPRSRRMGTGMPGYAAGWFRLASGEKSLVYLTRWDRVAYVPTREGYSLLLSVEQPESFLEALGAP